MTPRSRHPPAVQYPLQRSAVLGALLVCWLLGSAMVLAALVVVGARAALAARLVPAAVLLVLFFLPVLGRRVASRGSPGWVGGKKQAPGRFHGHFPGRPRFFWTCKRSCGCACVRWNGAASGCGWSDRASPSAG